MVTPATRSLRGFNCANCGAAVELRALTHTVAVACTSCGAILDPRDPTLVILQEAALRQRYTPVIPLGTRGTWQGHPFEVVGFQRRSITVDDEDYGWNEYVLFNPYYGFRYLSEYNGHWNAVRAIRSVPAYSRQGDRPTLRYQDKYFRHFQTAVATTDFVLGEFPWRVRAHDTVETSDFIAPPLLLSLEATGDEKTWSLGEYVPGEQVWEAFKLPGEPPAAEGVFANQPSPYTGTSKFWSAFLILAALLLLLFAGREVTAAREVVYSHVYQFTPSPGEAAFVTDTFQVGSAGTVEIDVDAAVDNSWLYLDLALVNMESGTALNLAREVGYYSGTDSDGAWTEGSRHAEIRLPAVQPGQYYLRVEPEAAGAVRYNLTVRRDVPSLIPYAIAFVLLVIPPILATFRPMAFERARWQESDHAS
ncbi:MAG: DUF4178 domain-containing protein [Vicinamibacterales bacterium]